MKIRFFSLIFIPFILCPFIVSAQQTSEVDAVITEIISEQVIDNETIIVFEATDFDGKSYIVDTAQGYTKGYQYNLKEGTRVILQIIDNSDGSQTIFLSNVVRTHVLFWMFLLFSIITIAIGLRRGALALLGLAITLLILFGWIMPQIISGTDPVLMVSVGGIIIMFVNMHLVHGFTRKTFIAFGSIAIGLGVVCLIASLFTYTAQLTGLASEDASLLYLHMGGVVSPKGVLLAGIILGALGVLDDIAITQQETVSELIKADSNLSKKELYERAMRVGRHHIASVVNTLVLAYVGAAFSLFLLFYVTGSINWIDFLNTEIVAEEIVRTLAGTTGLVLLVPLSTWFAVLTQKR